MSININSDPRQNLRYYFSMIAVAKAIEEMIEAWSINNYCHP